MLLLNKGWANNKVPEISFPYFSSLSTFHSNYRCLYYNLKTSLMIWLLFFLKKALDLFGIELRSCLISFWFWRFGATLLLIQLSELWCFETLLKLNSVLLKSRRNLLTICLLFWPLKVIGNHNSYKNPNRDFHYLKFWYCIILTSSNFLPHFLPG